ncbi:hypothetical protein TNCV_293091 [Trichonephila clavipes]|nr:hypothetical protein TNCV_293091 [Trichonephila clavipes]
MTECGSNQEISPTERGGGRTPKLGTLYRSRAPAGREEGRKERGTVEGCDSKALDTFRENCGIIRKQASTDGGVLWKVMCVDVVQVRSCFYVLGFLSPDLSNESVNFAFVWRVSGIIPEFTKSIFSSDKLSDVFREAEVWVVINLVDVEAEIAFEILLDSVGVSTVEVCRSIGGKNIQCRPNGPIAQNITICVCPAWVPAGMSSIKIAEEKALLLWMRIASSSVVLMEPCGGL